MGRAVHAGWLAAAVLGVGACEVVAGLHDFEFPGATASSTSTGGAGGSGGESVCEHHTYPSPPAASDPGGDDVSFVAAVRRLDFGETDLENGPQIGYDLDSTCTCQGQGDSCPEPEYATADHCDGPGGRDNATAQLFKQAGPFSEDLKSSAHTERAENGEWTLLVRISDYNGLPNDTDVTVALYVSPGLDADPCLPTAVPAWDGTDPWPVGHTSLEPPEGVGGSGGDGGASGCPAPDTGYDVDQPRYFDENAYVSDGVVVASMPQIGIGIESSNVLAEIKMAAGSLSGRLVLDRETRRWRIEEGVLAGRWRTTDLLQTVAALLSDGEVVCTENSLYKAFKIGVCNFPDIHSGLVGPTVPCDALSAAIGYDAEEAQLGNVLIGSGAPTGCPPEEDPATDECP